MPNIVLRPDSTAERPLPGPVGYGWFHNIDLQTEVSLGRYLRLLRQRKWTLILSVLIIPVLAYLAALLLTPRYTATTTVMVSPQQFHTGDTSGTVSATLPESAVTVMSNQIEILRSLGLADRVVQQTGLLNSAEFNPTLQPPGRFDPVFAAVRREFRALLGLFGIELPEPPPTPVPTPEQVRLETVQAYLGALEVRLRGTSGAIEISFTSKDPELAQVVADALAEAFIVDKLQSNFDAVTRASQWLNERTATLREGVSAAERAVEEYRASSGLITGVTSNLATEQISQLNNELVSAQAALAQAEARLNQIRSNGIRTNAPEVLQSAVIQQLRAQEAQFRSAEAQLAVRLAANHPRLAEVKSQLADVQRLIAAEVERITAATQSELNAARARVEALQQNLTELRRVTVRNNEAEVTLRALQREAETRRNVLQQTLALSNQVSQQANIAGPATRILSRAALPLEPSSPNKRLIVGAAFVFAVIFGLLLIFIREMANRTFRSGDEVESVLGLPCLTLIPRVRQESGMSSVYDYVLSNPLSQFAEAIRSLRTSLWLQDSRPRSVVITSSRPREGKTMVAISLARLAALSGERAILIDCDIRQPSVGKALGETERKGLFNVLSGECALEEVIYQDPGSALHYITAGTLKANSARLMMTSAMAEMIAYLREQYDLVVIDSPPTLAMTDAQIVAKTADAVVYCVHWRGVARSVVLNGIKMLLACRANLIGTCLTKVDVKTHAKAGYLDSESYHPHYRGYYLK